MRKTVDEMLRELYNIDKNNNYTFRFYGGKTWEARNKNTSEGLHTDGGFQSVKKMVIKRYEKRSIKQLFHIRK